MRRPGRVAPAGLWPAVACCALGACGGPADSGAEKGSADGGRAALLAEGVRWRPDAPDAGPWTPPAEAEGCTEEGWRTEADFFEIQSDLCVWGVFSQPLLGDVAAGDRLRFVLWTEDLWAPVPYVATFAFAFGDDIVWEQQFDVPGERRIIELEAWAPAAQPAGALATLHLDNHGINSWRINDIELADP